MFGKEGPVVLGCNILERLKSGKKTSRPISRRISRDLIFRLDALMPWTGISSWYTVLRRSRASPHRGCDIAHCIRLQSLSPDDPALWAAKTPTYQFHARCIKMRQ